MDKNLYDNPLVSRYSSSTMSKIWSPQTKFSTWRRLWLALARAEQELGLPISDEQIDEMSAHLDDIDFELAAAKEKELRHDVMSHVHVFGEQCPTAKPIIHLGATSCYVTDNTELIQIRDSLRHVRVQLVNLIRALRDVALRYKHVPTLGFTHYQPAQLTTVGKRATLWLQDVVLDLENLEFHLTRLPFRGVKGTTGTQASFVSLFDGDQDKVIALDKRVTELMDFENTIGVCGQTYTRKVDFQVLALLSGIAQSAYKMAGDIRLLSNLKEIDEPFEEKQIGSSAMAYKRNPMRSERICSLSRYVISLSDNAANTSANQWFERTLDDSANRRIVMPQAFLAIDGVLRLASNVIGGMKIWPEVIKKRIGQELPFMATENIIMACVKAGGDRQELHEAIRVHSIEAGKVVKEQGGDNDLLERIAKDELFSAIHGDIDQMLDATQYIGRAPEQVEAFVLSTVDPILAQYSEQEGGDTEELKV